MAAICHTVYDKYVYVRGPQNLWEAGAPHPWDEGMADPHRNTSLPAACYRVKFGRRSNGTRSTSHPPEKSCPSRPAFQGHSRSLEPTRIDRLPMTSY